jgi:myo-inositol-1-phosphate synthase
MSDKVRVAIIGVGNCASSLVQGVQYYKNARDDDQIPGLMHVNLGGYHIRDSEFSLISSAMFPRRVSSSNEG